jgi:flagellar basal body rod protein FlgC
MVSISSIALSGIAAAQTRLNASAHNIANVNTNDFLRQEVTQTEQPGSGVSTSFSQSGNPGSAFETDMVSQLQAKNAFLANLAVFRTHNKMMGTLLDKKV